MNWKCLINDASLSLHLQSKIHICVDQFCGHSDTFETEKTYKRKREKWCKHTNNQLISFPFVDLYVLFVVCLFACLYSFALLPWPSQPFCANFHSMFRSSLCLANILSKPNMRTIPNNVSAHLNIGGEANYHIEWIMIVVNGFECSIGWIPLYHICT